MLTQIVFTTILATVLAFVIAGPIVAVAVARLAGFELTLPWDWLLLITAACLVATSIAVMLVWIVALLMDVATR